MLHSFIKHMLSLVSFALYVFSWIAVTHTDSKTFYAPCGHLPRDLLTVCVTMPFVVIMIMGGLYAFCRTCEREALVITVSVLVSLMAMVSLGLGAVTVTVAFDALGHSDCSAAMSSTEAGIDSPSAGTGIPLLGLMAVVKGVQYIAFGVALPAVVFCGIGVGVLLEKITWDSC